MSPEGISGGIVLSSATKAFVEPTVRDMLKKAGLISEGIREDFKIEGEEFTILCPEGVQRHTIFFRINKSLLRRKKKFKGKVKSIKLKSLTPLMDITSKAVNITPEGFEISYKPLESGDLYLLEVEYEIDSHRFIDDLVKKDVSIEAPKENKKEYWMHAELKHLDIFKTTYGNIELKDLDFFVNVAVHQDVKTSIPKYFTHQIEIAVKWLESTNRDEKLRLSLEHRRLKRGKKLPKKETLEFLKELQDLFLSKNFKRFIDVMKDFNYHQCIRGVEYYNLPFPTWPKFMTVISRTNLSYEQPVSEGLLVYKYVDFRKEVEKIFSKNAHKNSKLPST